MGEYTIAEAAQALGVHPNTIRRWIRKGRLPSRMAEGPGGQEHHIPAEAVRALAARRRAQPAGWIDHGSTTSAGGGEPGLNDGQATPGGVDTPSSNQGFNQPSPDGAPAAVPEAALQPIQRAREMAEYTEQLLGPWRRRVEEQAEEIGRLKAELGHAQQRVAEFEALTDELERERAAAGGDGGRPWWRFWSK